MKAAKVTCFLIGGGSTNFVMTPGFEESIKEMVQPGTIASSLSKKFAENTRIDAAIWVVDDLSKKGITIPARNILYIEVELIEIQVQQPAEQQASEVKVEE